MRRWIALAGLLSSTVACAHDPPPPPVAPAASAPPAACDERCPERSTAHDSAGACSGARTRTDDTTPACRCDPRCEPTTRADDLDANLVGAAVEVGVRLTLVALQIAMGR